MFELTNRELASVVLIGLAILLGVGIPKLRRALAPSVKDVLRHFFVWQIQIPLNLYFLYAAAIVYVGWDVGIWHLDLLKDTVIIVAFVGIPMLSSSVSYGKRVTLFRDTLRNTLSAAALIGFYINLESLPLVAELVLQPVILLLTILAALAARNNEHKPVKVLTDTLLALIGVLLLIYVTTKIAKSWSPDYGESTLSSLGLPVLLSLTLLPFIHVFAFIARAEALIRVLPNFKKKKLPISLRIAFIWGLHLRTKLANDFHGLWLQEIAEAQSIKEVRSIMSNFRKAVRARDNQGVQAQNT